jgi:large subunit ribosomal protein L29
LKPQEIRELSDVDLSRELDAARRETFNLRFRLVTKQLTNYREVNNVKKKIARLQTIIKEREMANA